MTTAISLHAWPRAYIKGVRLLLVGTVSGVAIGVDLATVAAGLIGMMPAQRPSPRRSAVESECG